MFLRSALIAGAVVLMACATATAHKGKRPHKNPHKKRLEAMNQCIEAPKKYAGLELDRCEQVTGEDKVCCFYPYEFEDGFGGKWTCALAMCKKNSCRLPYESEIILCVPADKPKKTKA